MKKLSILIMIVAAVAFGVMAQSGTWTPGPGSWVKVTGTSTMHDWEIQTDTVRGSLSFPAAFFDGGDGDVKATVTIPASTLKSHSARMDRVMYEALRTKQHPEIRYVLTSAKSTAANSATIVGDLTIAGKTRPVTMEVNVARADESSLFATGSLKINMRDFGIDPPTAMLGTIRTGEMVEVTFQWNVTTKGSPN